jgi:signal peptidase I
MVPTLRQGDRIIISKWAYRHRPPRRDDVVAFHHEGDLYVKRVIGVAGETVAVASGHVYINGKLLDENYTEEPTVQEAPIGTLVPPGKVFLLGDNRDNSEDSRDFGPVDVSAVAGRVTWIMWPIGRVRKVR